MTELKVKEADVLRQVKQLLGLHAQRKSLIFRRINVGPKIFGQGRFSSNFEMRGMPDLLVWIKNGPCLSWELKAPKRGRQSPDQKAFQKDIEEVGHTYTLIRSVQEAELALAVQGLHL